MTTHGRRTAGRPPSTGRRDLLVIASAAIVVFALGVLFDLFDRGLAWLEQHSPVPADDVLALLALTTIALAVFGYRRWTQARAEHALRAEAQARFQSLVEQVPSVTYTWDPGAGETLYVSPQVERMFGYTPQEWLEDPHLWIAVLHPEDRDRVVTASSTSDRNGTAFRQEYRALARDGHVIWIRDESLPVRRDEDGHPLMMQGVMYDITRQKEVETQLQEAENRFRTIVERVPAVAYTWDGADLPGTAPASYISPQIERLLGYRAQDWLDDPMLWARRVHAEDIETVLAGWEAAVAHAAPFAAEYRIHDAHDRVVWVRDEAVPVAMGDRGGPLYQGVLFDITEQVHAREQMREAETRYRTLVEHLPVVTYISDVAGGDGDHLRYVAPGIEELSGFSAQEWLSVPNFWRSVIHAEDRELVVARSLETDLSDEAFDVEYRLVRKDGSVVWVHDRALVVESHPGVTVWQGVIQDISARRRAEERRGEAEARFRTLVEQLPAITYIEEPVTGRNLYISPQIESVYGFTPEEWDAHPSFWAERIHPEDREWVLAADAADTGDRWSVDYRSIARDGRVLWVHNEAVLIRDARGEPLFWQGLVFDITESKEAEARVRDAEARYRALVEQVPVAVYVDAVDETSTAMYISPQYERLTGYTPEQRISEPGLWNRMLHPGDRERVLAESERTNLTGDPFDLEYRIVRADGRTAWLHDHAFMVDEPGGVRAWQGVLTDITERKLAQDALGRRDRILEAVGYAAERVLKAQDWTECIDDVLGRLGPAAEASRAFLYRNGPPGEGDLTVSLAYEWRAPTNPRIDAVEEDQDLPYRGTGFVRWQERLGGGEVLHGPVRDYPEAERDLLEPRGILSCVAAPIFVDGMWWGYIGFDHAEEREWMPAEIDALRVAANTLGGAIGREQGAHRLSAAEARYRGLIETIPAATYIDTVDALSQAIYMSPQVEEIYGYTPEEWREHPELWEQGLHPDDHDQVVAQVQRHLREGVPYEAEYRFRHRDGRWIWCHDESVTIVDDDGRPLFSQGVVFDITEQKQHEEQLRDAEERFRAIVEHVPSAIYLDKADATMQSLYISPQIEQITGVTPQEWLAQPDLWLTMAHPDDRLAVQTSYLAAATAREPWNAEYRLRTRDGRTIWVHDETTFLHDEDGNPTFMQGVISDITERKLAEQALRESEQREREAAERLRALDEMKNTFLAAVSHELRSPLTSILGLSLTLERTPGMGADDREDLLARLSSNARKLDRLLKDLLDIDRLSRGIVEPQYRAVDIGMLARRTVESLEALADRPVIIEADAVRLTADPAKVERILENLLMNAARHTEADRRIWLRIEPRDGGALIVVEDDGPGVPLDLREVIFEPFRQGPTASPHSPGTGIGLSLVARFAELHDGRAWVEDREGGGASFRVFLPDRDVDAARGGGAEPAVRDERN